MATWIESKNNSRRRNDSWNRGGERVSVDDPSPTMMAAGMGGDSYCHWFIARDHAMETVTPSAEKPPYRVPSSAEIRAVPWNGLTVASTFSGTGGTCLGYRMAGYRVAWANDCDPSAQRNYRINHPETHLDTRDIRQVDAADILRALAIDAGDLDVFEGSPPCTAFSTAGRRSQNWGKVREHAGRAQVNVEDLFFEWIRLLGGLRPRVFQVENVAGLVTGVAKGYFKDIFRRMRAHGYRVEARLLDAQWLGVPQMRRRVIIVGVREDLSLDPAWPAPLPYRYSVRDALPWITRQGDNGGYGGGAMRAAVLPSPTIGTSPTTGNGRFPPGLVDAEVQDGAFPAEWHSVDRPSPAVMASRTVDVRRRMKNRDVVGDDAAPSIDGYAIGEEYDRLPIGQSSDRFFNLIRADPRAPSPTVLASGGGFGGGAPGGVASVVHPYERRKFTILELKRICAFPDDFALEGGYAQQWARLGNAVPPVMAYHIAAAIARGVFGKDPGPYALR